MKKRYLVLGAAILSTSVLGAFADETGSVETPATTTSVEAVPMVGNTGTGGMMPKHGGMMKEGKMKLKEEIETLKKEHKDFVKENRGKIKENLDSFKAEHGQAKNAFSELTEDQKNSLKKLNEEHKAQMKALQDEFKSLEKTDENLQAHREKVEALRAQHFASIQEIVGDNAKAAAFVEARKAVFEENSQIRAENTQARIETRGEIEGKVVQYKEAFAKKLVDKLPKIKEDKLQKLLDNVSKMITKTEGNSKLKQENKDKILSQLTSLKELIEEELDSRTAATEEINIDEILK